MTEHDAHTLPDAGAPDGADAADLAGPFGAPPPPRAPGAPGVTGAHRRRFAATLAALALVGTGAGVAIGYSAFSGDAATPSALHTSSAVSTPAATVDPGLVDIDTVLGEETATAAGTGMVLTATGIVLTNNHVVEGATTISVTDVGNGRTYTASVVGYDVSADVAVLKLAHASGLTTVTTADSSDVAVGEAVVAVGNAGGTGGTPLAARGTVTALDRSIAAADELSGSTEDLSGLIETDADVQAGDSGGPLVDAAGAVVGMDTAASSGSYGAEPGSAAGTQAYAIPIGTALRIARLIESGDGSSTVHIGTTAFLGVAVRGAGTPGSTGSVTVVGVETGSPAAGAGIVAGDVITAVGATSVTSAAELSAAVGALSPGSAVTVTWRTAAGVTSTATVTLVSGPAG